MKEKRKFFWLYKCQIKHVFQNKEFYQRVKSTNSH